MNFEVDLIQFDPVLMESDDYQYPVDRTLLERVCKANPCFLDIEVSRGEESLVILLMFVRGERAYVRLLEYSNFIVTDPFSNGDGLVEFFDVDYVEDAPDENSSLVKINFSVPIKYTIAREQAWQFLDEWLSTGKILAGLVRIDEPQS